MSHPVSRKYSHIPRKIISSMPVQPAVSLINTVIPSAVDESLVKLKKIHGQYDSQINIFWSSGACMIVQSEAWKKCGGFDADFFAHMEEIDLCWRFNKAGYRVCYLPESVIYHVGGGTLPYSSPFKTYLNFRNSLFLLYKNLPDDKLQSVLFKRRLLDGVAAIFFLMKGSFASVKSVWKAHMDYYKALNELKKKREIC